MFLVKKKFLKVAGWELLDYICPWGFMLAAILHNLLSKNQYLRKTGILSSRHQMLLLWLTLHISSRWKSQPVLLYSKEKASCQMPLKMSLTWNNSAYKWQFRYKNDPLQNGYELVWISLRKQTLTHLLDVCVTCPKTPACTKYFTFILSFSFI